MNLQAMVTDNISELLVKILEFTQNRQKILTLNINRMYQRGFIPMDLAVEEFSDLLNTALEEHMLHQRLVLCDTENIKFGAGGELEVKPVIDEDAFELLEECQEEYIGHQIKRLLENSLNQRVAAELLREREMHATAPCE
ncbi:MAG: hypothetical protein JXN61_12515 [Sedimentisphaerales bacterium]|nr:hypothetical protein [Sedimentisphaerales bacterium]